MLKKNYFRSNKNIMFGDCKENINKKFNKFKQN